MQKFSWPSIAAIIVILVGLSEVSKTPIENDAVPSKKYEAVAPGEAGTKMALAEILQRLRESGYKTILGFEFENGTFEVKGRKTDGSHFLIHVDPDSGEIVDE